MSRIAWIAIAVVFVMVGAASWWFFQSSPPAPAPAPAAETKAASPAPAPSVRAPSPAAAAARPEAPVPPPAATPPAPAQPPVAAAAKPVSAGRSVPLGPAREAVQKNPHDSKAWQTLAQAHRQLGEAHFALAAIKRAAALDRKWAGSPEGKRTLKQFADEARHPSQSRGGH